MSDQRELPRYRCHKEVWAFKIAHIFAGREDGIGPGATLISGDDQIRLSVPDAYMSKHSPKEGGYYVAYKDGYQSFSPAEAFEDGYTRLP